VTSTRTFSGTACAGRGETGFSAEAVWNGGMTIILIGKAVAASGVNAAKICQMRTRVSLGEQSSVFCKLF
jgi:hypothetical protein